MSVVRDTGRITAAGLVLAGVAALVVVVLGVEHAVRAWYGLHPSSPSAVSVTCAIVDEVLPYLRHRGVTEDQIDSMLVGTPRRYFDNTTPY